MCLKDEQPAAPEGSGGEPSITGAFLTRIYLTHQRCWEMKQEFHFHILM